MMKRLPDAEFEVMKVIWNFTPPVTTLQIMENLESKDWKPQTVLTMLVRLIEKGFLSSERIGRERNYTPIVREDEYMNLETDDFMKRYSGNSVGSLVKALYDGKKFSEKEIQELKDLFAGRS